MSDRDKFALLRRAPRVWAVAVHPWRGRTADPALHGAIERRFQPATGWSISATASAMARTCAATHRRAAGLPPPHAGAAAACSPFDIAYPARRAGGDVAEAAAAAVRPQSPRGVRLDGGAWRRRDAAGLWRRASSRASSPPATAPLAHHPLDQPAARRHAGGARPLQPDERAAPRRLHRRRRAAVRPCRRRSRPAAVGAERQPVVGRPPASRSSIAPMAASSGWCAASIPRHAGIETSAVHRQHRWRLPASAARSIAACFDRRGEIVEAIEA